MLSASVAQNATTPITDGKKATQNAPPWSVAGAASIGSTPPAAVIPQANSATAARPSVGAANAAGRPIACGPGLAQPTASRARRPATRPAGWEGQKGPKRGGGGGPVGAPPGKRPGAERAGREPAEP